MLLPAALCVSVSIVQAGGRVVSRAAFVRHPPYDPLSALRTSGRLALFLTVAAVPYTTAGILACVFAVAACVTWATTLNVVLVGALCACAWAWATPAHAATPPTPKPLQPPRAATALTLWTAMQLTIVYAAQIPQVRRAGGAAPLAWLNLGVFWTLPTVLQVTLLAAHVASLAALYLALVALRCTHDPETRVWPQPHEVCAAVDEDMAAQRADMEAAANERAAALSAQSGALASPMAAPRGGSGVREGTGDSWASADALITPRRTLASWGGNVPHTFESTGSAGLVQQGSDAPSAAAFESGGGARCHATRSECKCTFYLRAAKPASPLLSHFHHRKPLEWSLK